MKTLIIYYSLDGNTKAMSEAMAQAVGADILELKPAKDVATGSFAKYFWGGRQVLFKETPELRPFDLNQSNYDLFIIGTPVWVGTYAPPIRTFFEKNEIRSKKVALFCCCDGGAGKTIANMKERLKDNQLLGELTLVKTAKNLETNKKIAWDWAKTLL